MSIVAFRRFTQAGLSPSVNDLAENELVINLADKLGYFRVNDSLVTLDFGGGSGPGYVHPTGFGNVPAGLLSGATVISQINVNSEGHVTGIQVRNISASDVGANFYVHPSGFTGSSTLSGATVFSNIAVNSEGHVTGFTTRNLTAANVGAAASTHVLDSSSHSISGKTAGQLLLATSATTFAFVSASGDVTINGSGVTLISNAVVSNAKLGNMATSTIKGRATAGSGAPEDLTATQVRTILNVADGANNYIHPSGFSGFGPISGALVISALSITSEGHVNGVSTRSLTPADIGAAAASHVLDSASHTISGKTAGQLLLATSATTFAFVSASGDVTINGSGVTLISNAVVTNSKLGNMATSTIKGRATAGTGAPEDLTATQVRSILNVADGANNYVHPSGFSSSSTLSGATVFSSVGVNSEGHVVSFGTRNLTPADIGAASSSHVLDSASHTISGKTAGQLLLATASNTFAFVSASGDVTINGSGVTLISNAVVTNTKLANVSTGTIKGRASAGTGSPEDLTPAQVRTLLNVQDGANNYVHPTGFTNAPTSALTGQSVVSRILVNSEGHVTGVDTRNLGSIVTQDATNVNIEGKVLTRNTGGDFGLKTRSDRSDRTVLTAAQRVEASFSGTHKLATISYAAEVSSGTYSYFQFGYDYDNSRFGLFNYFGNPVFTIDTSTGQVYRNGTQELQDKLVSGSNIKTINGLDLTGSGNITITTTATPAGVNRNVQFNNSGSLGADSNFSYRTDGILTTAQGFGMFPDTLDFIGFRPRGNPGSSAPAGDFYSEYLGGSGRTGLRVHTGNASTYENIFCELYVLGDYQVDDYCALRLDYKYVFPRYKFEGRHGGSFRNVWVEKEHIDLASIEDADIVNPDAGFNRIYSRVTGNQALPVYRNSSGKITAFGSHPAFSMMFYWQAVANQASLFTHGFLNPLTVGSLALNSISGSGNYYQSSIITRILQGTAATNAVAALYTQVAFAFRGTSSQAGGFYFCCDFGISQGITSTTRIAVGLRAAVSAPTDVNPSTINDSILIGYDSADSNFQFMVRNTTTTTKVNTGIAKIASGQLEIYRAEIYCEPGATSISFRLTTLSNGATFVSTISTNLPAATVLLSPFIAMTAGGTSASPALAFKKLTLEV